MANRWSPTVVREPLAPERSLLATALEVGLSEYEKRKKRELEAARLAQEEERYQTSLAFQNRAEQRGIADTQRSIAATKQATDIATFLRQQELLKTHSLTKPPFDPATEGRPDPVPLEGVDDLDRARAGSRGMMPLMPGMEPPEGGFGALAAERTATPAPKAGNAPAGGQESQPQYPWAVEKAAKIKRDIQAKYGSDDATVTTVDPVSGQKMYRNPRKVEYETRMDALDKEIQAYRMEMDKWDRTTGENDRQRELSRLDKIEELRLQSQLRMEEAKAKAESEAASGPPDSVKKSLVEDEVAIAKLRLALDGVQKNPSAMGLKTILPNIVLGNVFSKGNPTRADVQSAVVAFRKSNFGTAVSKYEAESGISLLPAKGEDPAQTADKIEALMRGSEIHRKALMKMYQMYYTPYGESPGEFGGQPPAGTDLAPPKARPLNPFVADPFKNANAPPTTSGWR